MSARIPMQPKVNGDVVKQGYLKKLKTMRKKFFVLRCEMLDKQKQAISPARLEYYDSEKKWKNNQEPKKKIIIRNCFNINKRSDTKHPWVLALYYKNGCFSIVLENEEELESWLKPLLEMHQGEPIPEGEEIRPQYEHVWNVDVLSKDLALHANLIGNHLLCLNDQTLLLVKLYNDNKTDTFEFPLQKIRRCGAVDTFFYLEVGQFTRTGPGSLWMQTEDTNIAQNMHTTIMHACKKSSQKKDQTQQIEPITRDRSLSVNETSRPISQMHRWPTHTEENFGEELEEITAMHSPSPQLHYRHSTALTCACVSNPRISLIRIPSQRRHSVAVSSCSSTNVAVNSINHQRTYSFPLSPIPPARRASTGTRPPTKYMATSQLTTINGLSGGRERCDSMPSRARTTSEGANNHHPQNRSSFHNEGILSHFHPRTHIIAASSSLTRPTSMFTRTTGNIVNYSPPVGSSPVSPGSGACSTDSCSVGSSLSVDGELTDGMFADESRYSHSLTPDEPAILEENVEWPDEDEKLNNYIPTDTTNISNMQTINTNNTVYRKHSPNPLVNGFKSNSPSQGSYIDMNSPPGTSPLTNHEYLPMSPGERRLVNGARKNRSANHSRDSSVTEDDYVPMTLGDEPYVDMSKKSDRGRYQSGGDASIISSCSTTSGTDMRLSEHSLSSYLSPDDDITPMERLRAYSVGSRPTNANNPRIEVPQGDGERVRAFSVGSHGVRFLSRMTALHYPGNDKSDVLMELDFSKSGKERKNRATRKPSGERLLNSGSSSNASSYSTVDSGGPDLQRMLTPSFMPSPPKTSRLAAFLGRSPPKQNLQDYNRASPPNSNSLSKVVEVEHFATGNSGNKKESGYMDMTPGKSSKSAELSYVEMTFANKETKTDSEYMKMALGSSNDNNADNPYVEMGPCVAKPVFPRRTSEPLKPQDFPQFTPLPKSNSIENSNENYLDMSIKQKTSIIEDNNNSKVVPHGSKIEGYVDMNFTKSDKNNDSDSVISVKKDKNRNNKKEKNRYSSSQPITINTTARETIASFLSFGRKLSGGTPPKSFFAPVSEHNPTSPSASPHSSLARSKNKKNEKKKEQRTTGLTPPGNTSSIFPSTVTSPTSSHDGSSPKCFVDFTSGTSRILAKEDINTVSSSGDSISSEDNLDKNYDVDDDIYIPMVSVNSISPIKDLNNQTTKNNDSSSLLVKTMKDEEKFVNAIANLNVSSSVTVVAPGSSSSPCSETETVVPVNSSNESSRISDSEESNNSKIDHKDISRTPSNTSFGEKEIHYASLDLKSDSTTATSQQQCCPNISKATQDFSECATLQIPTLYAKIDFDKSKSN